MCAIFKSYNKKLLEFWQIIKLQKNPKDFRKCKHYFLGDLTEYDALYILTSE